MKHARTHTHHAPPTQLAPGWQQQPLRGQQHCRRSASPTACATRPPQSWGPGQQWAPGQAAGRPAPIPTAHWRLGSGSPRSAPRPRRSTGAAPHAGWRSRHWMTRESWGCPSPVAAASGRPRLQRHSTASAPERKHVRLAKRDSRKRGRWMPVGTPNHACLQPLRPHACSRPHGTACPHVLRAAPWPDATGRVNPM
jgi:hypothetical protein